MTCIVKECERAKPKILKGEPKSSLHGELRFTSFFQNSSELRSWSNQDVWPCLLNDLRSGVLKFSKLFYELLNLECWIPSVLLNPYHIFPLISTCRLNKKSINPLKTPATSSTSRAMTRISVQASNARGLQEAECTWDPRLRRLEKLPIVAEAIDKH